MKYFFIAILLLSVSLFAPAVTAQTTQQPSPTPIQAPRTQPTQGLNLTLSPTFINLTTDPGKSVDSQFRVTNNNAFDEYLQVVVAKMDVGSDGQVVLRDITAEDEFARWLTLSEEQFIIGPNQAKTVRFTLNPPDSASLGYYYTLLVTRVRPSEQEGQPQAVISGSAGITVLLDVRSPNAKKELQVVDFKPSSMVYEYLPTTLKATIKNTGNVHVVPFGDVFFDSMFNEEIAVLPMNQGRGNVLPNAERTFDVTWSDGFAVRQPKTQDGVVVKDSNGKEVFETTYDFSKANKFRIGKYTAHLVMVYDNGERDIPIEATVSFWVIPWKLILAAVAIVLGPPFLVFFLMRRAYKRR